jgi:hypothetical protein
VANKGRAVTDDADAEMDRFIRMFDRTGNLEPAATEPPPVDVGTEPKAIENTETESEPPAAAPEQPLNASLALILLQHLGVRITKHRDGTFTGCFKRCISITPPFRSKFGKKTPLDLLHYCWEGDSQRIAGDRFDDTENETEFRTWFNERFALMDAARFAKAGEAAADASVIAAELRPDKGGSTEAMTRLNKLRDAMKRRATSIIGMF